MSHRTLFYYDQESNVTCVRDADNGLTYHTYDLLNRMTSVKNPFGEVTYHEYTPGGQVKKRTLGNDTLTYYEYDDVGRVSKVDNRKSDLSVISTFEYEHDKVGNPAKITREDGSATYYSYDRIYQLAGETQVDDQGQVEYAFEYQYDKAHNRTVKVDNGTATYYAYNEANELTQETTEGETSYYCYDRCGNTTAKQEPSGTTYYQYDTENLMTRIDFADGSHNYFGYDADSKRVSKDDSDGFTEFVYQGPDMLKLLLERDDQGTTRAHYTMGDGLEAMRRDSTSSFYHYNHLGTTHELTDATQNITDTYRHDAWGVLLARTGSTVNPFHFVGELGCYQEGAVGLMYLRARFYRPHTGRFMSSAHVFTQNRYRYAEKNPLIEGDVSGKRATRLLVSRMPLVGIDRNGLCETVPVGRGDRVGLFAVVGPVPPGTSCPPIANACTGCNLDEGRMWTIIRNTDCDAPCTDAHEGQHRYDDAECCKRAAKCIADNHGSREDCLEAYTGFIDAINDLGECRAHRSGKYCREKMAAAHDCWAKGCGTACCDEIIGAIIRRDNPKIREHCAGIPDPWSGAPIRQACDQVFGPDGSIK